MKPLTEKELELPIIKIRCTRNKPYHDSNTLLENRQGYYIEARTLFRAKEQMCVLFPGEWLYGFTAHKF